MLKPKMPSRVLQHAFKTPWEAPKSLQEGAWCRLQSKIYNSYHSAPSIQVTLLNSRCTDHNAEATLHRSLFTFHTSMFLMQSALRGVYRPQFMSHLPARGSQSPDTSFTVHHAWFLFQCPRYKVLSEEFIVHNSQATFDSSRITDHLYKEVGSRYFMPQIRPSTITAKDDDPNFSPSQTRTFPTQRLRSNKNRVTQFTSPSHNEKSQSAIYSS